MLKLLNRLKGIRRELQSVRFNKELLEDSFSYSILKELYPSGFLFPYTSSSVRFSSLQVMVNDILLNDRSKVIEFGSGLSTITFAFLFKKLNRKGRVVSVEDSLGWTQKLNKILEQYELQDYATIIHAPLVQGNFDISREWYNEDTLNSKISDLKFDMVFVDGPMAYLEESRFNRYKALPFVISKLESSFSIFLDDVHRRGEKEIIARWEKEFSIEFKVFENNSIGYSKVGPSFNILPFKNKNL